MDRAEMEGANKTETFVEDMLYAASNYFVNPNYLKINGTPVIFLYSLYYLYQEFDYSTAPFEYARDRLADMNMTIYFVGDAVTASTPDASSPLLQSMDAVTSYFFEFSSSWQTVLDDMNTYYPQWLSSMNSIGVHFIPNAYPGFDDSAFIYGSNRILPRNQSMLRRTIDISRKYLDPQLKILMVTSWNEWHESTAIEPAIEWGETYLQKLHTINVPEDYPKIQEAINNANQGDTILVSNGTYYENVIVNKTISLIGENRNTTVIDGGGFGRTVHIVADNVTIKGFTIRNSGYGAYDGGLWIASRNVQVLDNNLVNNSWSVGLEYPSIRCVIKGNSISGQEHSYAEGGGILITNSTENSIIENIIACYEEYGIYLNGTTGNLITGNFFMNNLLCGIYVKGNDNVIYHNNFMETSSQVNVVEGVNIWDDGYPSGGNYWSDYTGIDANGDGIGDTHYTININNTDKYPLMNPWGTGSPVASFSWYPLLPKVGELVTFNASASMPIGGEIVSYTWDFGDGNYAYGEIVTYQYASADNFTVTLNVTDSENLWEIEQKQIEVKALTYNLSITVSAGGTTEPSPGIYTYENGTIIEVTAIPESGYSFDYWLLDNQTRTENPVIIIMDSNYTLEAYFVDDIPPEISEPIQDPPPDNVQPFQNVTIRVNVTDYGTGVKNVTLWYSWDNGTTWTPLNMTALLTFSDATITYEATIPGYENCTWITYKIVAYDNAGNNATKDNNHFYYKYYIIPEFSINMMLISSLIVMIIALILAKKAYPKGKTGSLFLKLKHVKLNSDLSTI